jgi:predicted ATP-grasp superfamily ATP-dependent carboligase
MNNLNLKPAILLGGDANALSVARDLGRMNVPVHVINESDAVVRHSRYTNWIDVPRTGTLEQSWAAWLLSPAAEHLHGSVLLACSDAGLQVLIKNRPALQSRYLLDDAHVPAQTAMLDKLTTYEHAQSAGVITPRFWKTSTREQILALRDDLVFPLMVKPRLSHLFEAVFDRKHVIVDSFDQLLATFDTAAGAGMDTLLMEHIPGGDDRLCSYFTYLDENSDPLFHFTKRIIRRHPAGMGAACYHITDRIPEIQGIANRLFKHVGLRGLANVEFKQDPRDAKYKLIECNARFVASNCLVSAAGISLAKFVYCRLAGLPLPPMESYKSGLRLWDPFRDLKSLRELRALNQITFAKWLTSIAHRQTFQYFSWPDPMPALARALKPLRRVLNKKTTPTPTPAGSDPSLQGVPA